MLVMDVELDIKMGVEENAGVYFDKAKKLKKKISGVEKTIAEFEKQLAREEKKQVKEEEQQKVRKIVKKEWFDKYRWFVSSDGFLVVAGRDATTNEMIIKKNTDAHELVFHTDMQGSPFVVVKNPENKVIPDTSKEEAASYCASLSKAWKRGLSSTEVYAIMPEQVSKEAKSGEYLGKGSFMIYGKREYFDAGMSLALCVYKDKVMMGPVSAVQKHANIFVIIKQGNKKLSDVAKTIVKKIDAEVDDVVRALPQGSEIAK